MAKLNTHHIKYAGVYKQHDWTVEITGQMHRLITIIQRSKPTTERYILLTNLLHAITEEWNRYRELLETGHETRERRRLRMKRKRKKIKIEC